MADAEEARRRQRPVAAGHPAEEGGIRRAADEYTHWDEITQTVLEAFVAQGRGAGSDYAAGMDDAAFYRIVDACCNHNPHWNVPPAGRQRLVAYLRQEFFGFGPLAPWMELDGLEEIMCNTWDSVFFIVRGQKRRMDPSPFRSEKDVRDFLSRVLATHGREINLSNPMEDATLPDGSRVHAEIPPLAVEGATFNIRKFNPQPFTMDQYLSTDMFNEEFLADLQRWIWLNANLVVAGGTASGKAQPLTAKVLSPTGWRRMGDLEIGDLVVGSDGQPTTVTGVYPQGKKEVYRLTFDDGAQTECCLEHLWALAPDQGPDPLGRARARVVSLAQILAEGLTDASGRTRFRMPTLTVVPEGAGLPAQPTVRVLLAVEPAGAKECRCIRVNAADHLYVTDDGILSHNTTFLNAIGQLLPSDDRVIVVENTKELRIRTEDTIYKQAIIRGTHEGAGDSGAVTIRDAIRGALRQSPDRLIVGEVRSREAIDLLDAMNTGHDGSWSTIHADSPVDVISRLEGLAMRDGSLPIESIQDMIGRAVDVCIQVGRFPGSPYRKVLEAWQVLHPIQIELMRGESLDAIRAIREARDLRKVKDRVIMFPLYQRDAHGQLVKRHDFILPPGKKTRPDPGVGATA